MSKVVYEYELNARLGPHHATAIQVKLRVRAVSKMIAKKVEVARRKLYNKVEDNQLVWYFADDHTRLDSEDCTVLNTMMDEHYKERRVESNIYPPAVGISAGQWHQDRRKP